MVDGRAALAAEDTVNGLARRTGTSVALGRAGDGQLVLGDDGDESCRKMVLVDHAGYYDGEGFGVQYVEPVWRWQSSQWS